MSVNTLRGEYLINYKDYIIYDEYGLTNDVLYSGRIDYAPAEGVDLMPIIRQLIKPEDYSNYFSSRPNVRNNITKGLTFYDVSTGTEDPQFFNWDYSDNVITQQGAIGGGIQDYLYSDQYFPLNFNGDELTRYNNVKLISRRIETGGKIVINNQPVNTEYSFFIMNNINTVNENYEYYYADENTNNIISKVYKGIECRPDNVITLYYLDVNGALSWLHCEKKNVIENKITRNQITHCVSLSKLSQFGIDNYNVQSYRTFTLNTNWLNDEQSKRVQDLLKSPKIWLQEYKDGNETQVISVICEDNSSVIKNRQNDKLFNYTIKVRESKTENIYV